MSPTTAVADDPEGSRYEITVDGEPAGFATYRLATDVITLLHTEVDPEREGHGIGSALVRGVLDDARVRGLAVRPVCPFVVEFIERHREYADLVAG